MNDHQILDHCWPSLIWWYHQDFDLQLDNHFRILIHLNLIRFWLDNFYVFLQRHCASQKDVVDELVAMGAVWEGDGDQPILRPVWRRWHFYWATFAHMLLKIILNISLLFHRFLKDQSSINGGLRCDSIRKSIGREKVIGNFVSGDCLLEKPPKRERKRIGKNVVNKACRTMMRGYAWKHKVIPVQACIEIHQTLTHWEDSAASLLTFVQFQSDFGSDSLPHGYLVKAFYYPREFDVLCCELRISW